jgi:tetratricopeptide (TPR) repeat protein
MGRSSAPFADPGRSGAVVALALAVICAVGGIAYANSFGVPFVFDDWNNIVDNPFIRWAQADWASLRFTLVNSPLSRPVAYASFALNYWLGGYEPPGYHALSLAIHLGNAMLVYALARVTLARVAVLPGQAGPAPSRAAAPWLALFAALVFVAHPIQTQSVTYVVQRMNLLCAFFYLASLLCFVRGRLAVSGLGRIAAFAGCAACGLLALGSKENAATLPIALWLYDWFFLRDLRDLRGDRALFWLVGIVALGAGVFFGRGGFELLDHGVRDFSLGERLLTQPRVIWLYLSLIALPLPGRLNLAHDVAVSRGLFDPPATALALLGIVLLLALGAWLARRHRLASFATLWFLLQLAIESSVFPLELVFEHRTYLPLVAPCIALALPLSAVARGWPLPTAAAAGLLVAALGTGTWLRNQTWQSEVGLWADAVAKSPELPRAHINLGVAYARVGEHERAVASYQRALALAGDTAELHYDLVFSLRALGRNDEAERALAEVLRLEPDHAGALHLQGEEALRRGELDAAIGHFEAALKSNTRLAPSYHQLGIALLRRGRIEDATAPLQAAARLDPRLAASARHAFAIASGARGLDRLAVGDQTGAVQDLRAALDAAPHDAIAANALAWILATSPDPALRDAPQAVLAAELAQRARPDDADFLDTLGAAYAAAGRFDEAVAAAERADALAHERGDDGLRDRIRERLRRYRAKEAWTEGS